MKYKPSDFYELVDGKVIHKKNGRLAPAHNRDGGYWRYSPKRGVFFSASKVLSELSGTKGKLLKSAPYPEMRYFVDIERYRKLSSQ